MKERGMNLSCVFFFFSSRRRHTRLQGDWSSDVCSSDLHVAGVLLVSGSVGDDELAPGRGEIAVGDVDGDALLALRLEPVGEQRQVEEIGRASCRERV